jgi:hypothetical protein
MGLKATRIKMVLDLCKIILHMRFDAPPKLLDGLNCESKNEDNERGGVVMTHSQVPG